MKIIAILTTILLSFSALADAGSMIAFEKALDEYQYAVTTEWDQKDAKTLAGINSVFESEVKSLVNLEEADILAVLAKKSISKQDLAALKLRMSLARASGNPEAEFAVMKEELNSSFHQGASWSGDATIAIVSSVLFIGGFLAFMISLSTGGECLEEAEYIDCDRSGFDCRPVTRCKTYSI